MTEHERIECRNNPDMIEDYPYAGGLEVIMKLMKGMTYHEAYSLLETAKEKLKEHAVIQEVESVFVLKSDYNRLS